MQQKLSETVEILVGTIYTFSSCGLISSSSGRSGGRGRILSHWRRDTGSIISRTTLCFWGSFFLLKGNTFCLGWKEHNVLPAHNFLTHSYVEKDMQNRNPSRKHFLPRSFLWNGNSGHLMQWVTLGKPRSNHQAGLEAFLNHLVYNWHSSVMFPGGPVLFMWAPSERKPVYAPDFPLPWAPLEYILYHNFFFSG